MTDIYPARCWQIKITGHYSSKTTHKPTAKKSFAKDGFNPPKHEIDAFARCILPAIQAFFNTEAGRSEFAEWMAAHKRNNISA
ncbi:MAG TPA: hypothetical protein DEQ02_06765 [Ruminococcaceae bacterium]|nr:hypothetical protein [Oscillospiraceae bacterium]